MKFCRKYILAIACLILVSQSIYASDGNDLLSECLAAEHYMDTKNLLDDSIHLIASCFGLLEGVRNTMMITSDNAKIRAYCPPENGITNGQATRIVIAYLKKNPTRLHEDRVLLAILAFMDAYPCK